MSDFEFIEITEKNKAQLDAFILKNEYGSIHQIFEWSEFQKTIPGRSVVRMFGIKQRIIPSSRDKEVSGNRSDLLSPSLSQEFLATVLCVQMDTGFRNKKWWYSPRGPVFSSKNQEAGAFLIQKVKEILSQEGMFWRLDPYMEIPKIPGILFRSSTQDYQPTDTLELDLTKTDELLLSEMKRKGRYNIKLSQKKGVEFVSITGKDFKSFSSEKKAKLINNFWSLNTETFARDGFSGHEKSYYQKFLELLPEYATLFFATFQGKNIATAISTFVGGKAIYYFGASTSDSEYRKLMAPYGLQWFMIQYAKERSCKTYDFLGIAPEGESNHAYAGISEFKWKFGGYRKVYPKGKEIVFTPFWYGLYRLVKKLR